MRHLLLLVSTVCLLGSPACMVIEEIDNASAKMPTKKAKKKATSDAGESTESAFAQQKDAVVERSKEWWNQATSLSSQNVDSAITTCTLGGSTQFMTRDDCLSRGGRPSGG